MSICVLTHTRARARTHTHTHTHLCTAVSNVVGAQVDLSKRLVVLQNFREGNRPLISCIHAPMSGFKILAEAQAGNASRQLMREQV